MPPRHPRGDFKEAVLIFQDIRMLGSGARAGEVLLESSANRNCLKP